ncbi:MAG: type I secretion system permease/ATPase [Proteobacteria bacterium]|nr:type I secretion system permease/ATPase [Pseudomonadota bacterium]
MTDTMQGVLAQALAACREGYVAVAVFSLCINVLMLTSPIYMLSLFDRVLTSYSMDTLLILTLIAGIALLTMGALDGLRTLALIRIGTWLDAKLSGPLLAGSITATLRHGTDPSVQALRDLATFRGFVTGPMLIPLLDAPWTPIFIAVIFLLHPSLGWMSLVGGVVLFALAVANEAATRRLVKDSGAVAVRSLKQAEAAVRNADVVEAMGMMPNLLRRWQAQNAESLALQARAGGRSGGISALSKFVRLALQVGILALGAWLVLQGELTAGGMMAASIIMGRALAPVEQSIGGWKLAISARDAYQRLKAQLARVPARGLAMPLPAPLGALSVEGVSYVHPNSTLPVLHNVGFELRPGEALGLVGPSAAGKTTLARLLVGNLRPRLGHVRLDGMDVSDWSPEDLGRHVGYLPQDVELFAGTIHENIARMGESEPEAVIAAARLAGVHDLILHLPTGYEMQIGEGGASLSAGQRQRIALARALFGEPRFVVLDEPNSNLDHSGEEALLNALVTLKQRGVTVVVIAHRANILRQVDRILVLRGGGVHMFGPRDEIVPRLLGPAASEPMIGAAERGRG